MPKIIFPGSAAALTTQYVVIRKNDGTTWNGTALEAYTPANLATYKLAAASSGTGSYEYEVAIPALPGTAAAPVSYGWTAYTQAGGAPALSDSRVASGSFAWDGANEVAGLCTPEAGVVASVTGAVGSVTGNVGGNVVGSVASVVGAVGSVTGFVTLASAGLDQITVETGVNARQALSPILGAACGVLSGAGTGTIVIKGGNVATTRVTADCDSAGNRTAVTLTLPT